MQDTSGATIPLVNNDQYVLKPDERVTLKVEVQGSAKNNVKFEYVTTRGKMESGSIYIAPDEPGRRDLITIRAVDSNTREMIAQAMIKIKIIDKR